MTTLIADTFTAADGTAISGRTPDTTVSSRTWSTGDYFLQATGTIDIQSNKARMTSTDDGFAIDCGASEYTVTWICTLPASGQFRGGCRFRIQNAFPFANADASDYYFFAVRFDLASGNIRMVKVVDNVETVIGSDVTMSFSYNTTYTMKLVVSGNTYTLYVDNVQKKSETDTTWTGGTWIGFGAGAVSGNDFTIDSVQVDSNVSIVARRSRIQRVGSRG